MMGCACNQSSQLLGGLMGDVSGRPVHIEAPFSLGVELRADSPWYSAQYGTATPEAIAAALNESDYASGVTAYELSGFIHPFIVIQGYSAMEFGRDSHLRNALLSIVDALPNTAVQYGTVRWEVETYDPATGQTEVTRSDAPAGGDAGHAPPEPEKPSWFDQLALDLGIKKSEAQLLVFGGVALLVVLLTKR